MKDKRQIGIVDFFNTDYVDQASYDNLRKIASCIDGLKNSSRKVITTVLDKNIKERIKVQQLSSKSAEYTQYLHGSLDGVIVTLAQDFAGSNNIALLEKKGNFGSRFIPSASASRYIYAKGSDSLFKLFKNQDREILERQTFEGAEIEPKFYVPSLPMILINGSEGVSFGFAQKVYPRNASKIREALKKKIKDINYKCNLLPYFEGLNAKYKKGEEENKYLVRTAFRRGKSQKNIKIIELPFGSTHQRFLKHLDKIKALGHITKFTDLSDDDGFLYECVTSKPLEDEGVVDLFKLETILSENLTCIDENLKIIKFNNIDELLTHYVNIKMKYLGKRKQLELANVSDLIKELASKCKFVRSFIENEIETKGLTSIILEKFLDEGNYYKKDESYSYLMRMPMQSMTQEKYNELKNSLKSALLKEKELQRTHISTIWENELLELKNL